VDVKLWGWLSLSSNCKQFATDLPGNGYTNLSVNIFIITKKTATCTICISSCLEKVGSQAWMTTRLLGARKIFPLEDRS
jgi:hypothetical protein